MSQKNENHLLEEELVNAYYQGFGPNAKLHIDQCAGCARLYRTICDTLDPLNEVHVPGRGPSYGAEVWARLLPHLSLQPSRPVRSSWWLYAPAAAALLLAAFLAGMFTEHSRVQMPVAKLEVAHIAPQQVQYQPPTQSAEISHNISPRHRVHARASVHFESPVQTSSSESTPADVAPQITPDFQPDQDGKLLELSTRMENNPNAALPSVLDMIHGSPSNKTREHALFVLAQSDSPQASQALMDLARQPANPELQVAAVRMIGMVRGDQGRRELAGLYTSSSNPALKHEILNGLMLAGSKSTLLAVAKAEPDRGLRNSAIANLSFTGGQDELSQLYKSGATPAEKKQILDSVFLMGDTDTLLDVLKHEKDPALRVAALNSLGAMDGHSAVLTNLYQTEPNADVRRAIIDALAARHNTSALALLAHDEKDPAVKALILQRIAALRR